MSMVSPTRTDTESGAATGGCLVVAAGIWITVTVPVAEASPLLTV
nr:hypothetical protein BJQ95_02142 [Cryobacterium sp. SO1]